MVHAGARRVLGVLGLLLVVVVPRDVSSQGATPVVDLPEGVEVVAAGLTNPRGFTWGDDGQLFIGLAGYGGDTQLVVEGTPFPFMVGSTSSVASLVDGCAVPLAEGLGSAYWTDAGWTWGAMDVAILDGQLYVLAGAGSALGGNGIYRVLADGQLELVADLGAWMSENPVAFRAPDYDPTGSWFDLEAGTDRLWVSEAVGGQIVTVMPTGEITRVVDLSDGHLVPTGIVLDADGGVYVGFETTVPYRDGSSKVVHVAADGTVADHWTGLTAVTDLVMGPDGVLYAAEMATGNTDEAPFLTPNSGRVVRMTGPDSLEPVLTDVDAPVYLGFGDDGALYVSLPAFAADAGVGHGAVIRADLTGGVPVSLSGVTNLPSTCSGGGGTPAA